MNIARLHQQDNFQLIVHFSLDERKAVSNRREQGPLFQVLSQLGASKFTRGVFRNVLVRSTRVIVETGAYVVPPGSWFRKRYQVYAWECYLPRELCALTSPIIFIGDEIDHFVNNVVHKTFMLTFTKRGESWFPDAPHLPHNQGGLNGQDS